MAANPYTAPQSRVADIAEESEHQPVKIWSASGRLGRLRYLGYSCAALLLCGVFVAFAAAALGPDAAGVLTLVAYLPLIAFNILIGIQRSHDMNWSGWTIVLTIIPLVGLVWLFKSGTKGPNDYGNPPPPNTTGVKILASLFFVVVLVGMLAAIAIPAYSDYVKRAQQVQQSN